MIKKSLSVAGSLALIGAMATGACSNDDSSASGTFGSGAGAGAGVGDGGPDGSGAGSSFDFDSGSGSRDGGGGANTGPDGSCGASKFEADALTVNMLLVVDQSGSMNDPLDATTDKWPALETALGAAVDGTKDAIHFGLDLYPRAGTGSCGMPAVTAAVSVAIASDGASAGDVVTALGAATPTGGTPTAVALERAFEYYSTGAGASLDGDKYVVLATDGAPNCNSDASCNESKCVLVIDGICPTAAGNCCLAQPEQCVDDDTTLLQIQALAAAGIKTFVVGIPGSEDYEAYLNAFADAGGVPNPTGPTRYYSVDASGGVDALTAVFQLITTSVIRTCELQLQSVPDDIGLLNVEVDGETIVKEGDDGWEVDNSTDPPTIKLKGATCDGIEQNGAETVQVVYGCPTIFIQ